MKGRRYDTLSELVDAIDAVSPDGKYWREAAETVAGSYCTHTDEDTGQLHLFFIPPGEYARRHGFCTIPLTGDDRWKHTEAENGLTVTPSIFLNPQGTPPGWHGFLTDGEWITV